jgi:thiol-disulfide isomerase/thioredoxin
VLLFTSPSCGPCTALMPTVGEWQEEHADTLTIALANGGALDTAHASTAGLDHVYADLDMKVRDTFEAYGTPSAVLIAHDGTIASPVAAGAGAIENLVASAWDIANAPGHSLEVGGNAPDLALPTLSGGEVELSSLQGENTVLLFWNPDCGFCRDMHSDLQDWEENKNGHSPRLVVVSAGNPDEVAEEGFRSMVLLDRDSEGSTAFYAGGTPTAVLVGIDGRVRSRVVAGAAGVMALLASEV